MRAFDPAFPAVYVTFRRPSPDRLGVDSNHRRCEQATTKRLALSETMGINSNASAEGIAK